MLGRITQHITAAMEVPTNPNNCERVSRATSPFENKKIPSSAQIDFPSKDSNVQSEADIKSVNEIISLGSPSSADVPKKVASESINLVFFGGLPFQVKDSFLDLNKPVNLQSEQSEQSPHQEMSENKLNMQSKSSSSVGEPEKELSIKTVKSESTRVPTTVKSSSQIMFDDKLSNQNFRVTKSSNNLSFKNSETSRLCSKCDSQDDELIKSEVCSKTPSKVLGQVVKRTVSANSKFSNNSKASSKLKYFCECQNLQVLSESLPLSNLSETSAKQNPCLFSNSKTSSKSRINAQNKGVEPSLSDTRVASEEIELGYVNPLETEVEAISGSSSSSSSDDLPSMQHLKKPVFQVQSQAGSEISTKTSYRVLHLPSSLSTGSNLVDCLCAKSVQQPNLEQKPTEVCGCFDEGEPSSTPYKVSMCDCGTRGETTGNLSEEGSNESEKLLRIQHSQVLSLSSTMPPKDYDSEKYSKIMSLGTINDELPIERNVNFPLKEFPDRFSTLPSKANVSKNSQINSLDTVNDELPIDRLPQSVSYSGVSQSDVETVKPLSDRTVLFETSQSTTKPKLSIQKMQPIIIPRGLVIQVIPPVIISPIESQPDSRATTTSNIYYITETHKDDTSKPKTDDNSGKRTFENTPKQEASSEKRPEEESFEKSTVETQTEFTKQVGTGMQVDYLQGNGSDTTTRSKCSKIQNPDTTPCDHSQPQCKCEVAKPPEIEFFNASFSDRFSVADSGGSNQSAPTNSVYQFKNPTKEPIGTDPETAIIYKSFQVLLDRQFDEYGECNTPDNNIDEDVYRTFVNPDGPKSSSSKNASSKNPPFCENRNVESQTSSNLAVIPGSNLESSLDFSESDYNAESSEIHQDPPPTKKDGSCQCEITPVRDDKEIEKASIAPVVSITIPAKNFLNTTANSHDSRSLYSDATGKMILEIDSEALNKAQRDNLTQLGRQSKSLSGESLEREPSEYVITRDVSVQTSLHYSSDSSDNSTPSYISSKQPIPSTYHMEFTREQQSFKPRQSPNSLPEGFPQTRESYGQTKTHSKRTINSSGNSELIHSASALESISVSPASARVDIACGDSANNSDLSELITVNKIYQRKKTKIVKKKISGDDSSYCSEGEISCDCTLSAGEIHASLDCPVRDLSHPRRQQAEKLVDLEFKRAHMKVIGKKEHNANWVAYYVTPSESSEYYKSSGENSPSSGFVKK